MTHSTSLAKAGEGRSSWQRLKASPLADPVRLLSLVEQALISGANFLLLLGLGRAFPAEAFGLFSFAYISLQFLLNLHRSIVVVPFIIHTAENGALSREGWLWHKLNGAVILLAILVLGGVAGGAGLAGLPGWMGQAFLLAAAFVLPVFVYEFLRRWSIQIGRYGLVVAAGAVYAAVVAGGVALALHAHSLTDAALAYIGANLAAATVLAWPALSTAGQDASLGMVSFLRGLKRFLTWSLLANFAYNGFNQLPALILGAMAGPVPVGTFQALRNLTQPLNIIGTAVDNFDKPRAARALAEGGREAMTAQLRRTTKALVTSSVPYMVLIGIFAEPALRLIYADRYQGFEGVLYFWLGLNVLMLASYPFETGLMLLRRPELLCKGRFVAMAVAILVSVTAIPSLGVYGAMIALVSAFLVNLAFCRRYLKASARADQGDP